MIVGISSCAIVTPIKVMLSTTSVEKQQTLADLPPDIVPAQDEVLPATDLQQLRRLYVHALHSSADGSSSFPIKKRLAAIDLELAESEIAEGLEQTGMFDDAINSYQKLLENSSGDPAVAGTLYQLAKAYELNGELDRSARVLRELVTRFGDSDVSAEAYFRLAEYNFGSGSYREADRYYSNVIDKGPGKFYENAMYMHAWSQFKKTNYEKAIESFVAAIDGLVVGHRSAKDLQSIPLDSSVRAMLNDCLKMISVSFSSLNDIETLTKSFTRLDGKFYIADLYDGLAKYYLENSRYSDSAKIYEYFIDRFPLRDESFRFRLAQIQVFQQAGFASEVLQAKESFVEEYSPNGQFWSTRDDLIKEDLDDSLKLIIPELASYYHTLAQRSRASVGKQNNVGRKTKSNDKIGASEMKDSDSIEHDNVADNSDPQRYFLRAAHYYSLYISGFPNDRKTPEMAFLLAESQMEAGQFAKAIESYEIAAYRYDDRSFSAEAGYAAILTYDKLSSFNDSDIETIQVKKMASMQRFSSTFSSDKRSPLLLLQLAQEFSKNGDFRQAISAAESVVAWPQNNNRLMDAGLTRSALLVIAQSAFDGEDYVLAELNYGKVLDATDGTGQLQTTDLLDRYAASIYKQAEQARDEKDPVRAAHHFDRILVVAPDSKIRISAQFEAGNSYLKAQNWPLAIERLTDFRRRFPSDPMVALLGSSLAVAYQKVEAWGLAAAEVRVMSRGESDSVRTAQLLFLAAELYEKSGDSKRAIIEFRDYAHRFPTPVDINFEAMNKLNELYRNAGDSVKRRFWLRKIIKTQANIGDVGTARINYLAAMASSLLAEDANNTYKGIKLTLPIKDSLSAKKAALNVVINRYRDTLSYGVAEYMTLSSFHLAEVYAQLSRDLIESERPDQLDELALEQYELLLEEQAFPFEEKAIEIHEQNIRNSWNGVFDRWVQASFSSLEVLLPLRYEKRENDRDSVEGIF